MVALVVVALQGMAACEDSHFARARALDTVQAYRRFVARFPAGDRQAEAREALDRALYRQARRADRPLGYHRYLASFPEGCCATAARRRLARLALERARDVAGLELVLERYPDSPEAVEASQRLASRLATAALRSADPGPALRFVRRFPDHEDAARVREHLARLRLPKIPPRPLDLERFIDRHAGTAAARQAAASLRELLAREVEATADRTALAHFEARFGDDPALPALRRAVEAERRRRALARLDLERLQELSGQSPSPVLEQVLEFCRRRPRHCAEVRQRAIAAGPYRPEGSWTALSRRVFSPDLLVAWQAIAALGWDPDPRAGQRLVELVGSEQFALAWASARALADWVRRLPVERRERWASRVLQRLGADDAANPDDRQRRGFLLSLVGDRQGAALLRAAMALPGRVLVTGYLSLLAGEVAREDARRLVAAAHARLQALKQAFPGALDADSLVPAVLAERELFALGRALSLLPTAEAGEPQALLQREIEQTLATWRGQIAAVNPDFHAAEEISLAEEARAHEARRPAALARLQRGGDPASRAVAGALCAGPLAHCPAGAR